jgi:cis-3-alkyl-4-acyloxetan-2-one decarboxylase
VQRLDAPPLPDFIARQLPAGIRRYSVKPGPFRMHVMELGPEDARPVLMLHGNPTWGFLYRYVAEALRSEPLRLIMPDLVGLGFSDKPVHEHVHRLEAHAAWLGGLVDGLGLEQLVFVGQDWGGPIGLRALADRPERLGGLVLLNTVVGPPRPDFKPTAFHRFSRMPLVSDLVFRYGRFPQVALWTAQGDKRSIRGDVARAYRYPLHVLEDNLAPLALARMVPDSLEHPSIEPLRRCQALIESFQGPAEIVWGDLDPILGGVRSWIEKLLPAARVTRTRGGHFLQEEAPAEIAAAIRRVAQALARAPASPTLARDPAG